MLATCKSLLINVSIADEAPGPLVLSSNRNWNTLTVFQIFDGVPRLKTLVHAAFWGAINTLIKKRWAACVSRQNLYAAD